MGRRLILLLCAMATMVVVSAGVALAVNIRGTNGTDTCAPAGMIPGQPPASAMADDIWLGPGADTCAGLLGNDVINGDSGGDNLNGNGGQDEVYGGGGVGDSVNGNAGNDVLSVVDGDAALGGDDAVSGGPGTGDICAVDDPAELADATCETVIQ
jgi:hypothetical protein